MVGNRKVIWPFISRQQLKEMYDHIKKDSLKNAESVRQIIISATKELVDFPHKYPPDKYKLNNDGSFRAFELFHYRICYQVTENEIIIVRLRHTSMKPLDY
jgi:plasmid stabilization system protein ParE